MFVSLMKYCINYMHGDGGDETFALKEILKNKNVCVINEILH